MFKIYNLSGCLPFGFMILLFILFFKLWVFLILFLLALPAMILTFQTVQNFLFKKKIFEPKVGEVYKLCPYCASKCEHLCEVCPKCKRRI